MTARLLSLADGQLVQFTLTPDDEATDRAGVAVIIIRMPF